jgi:hypothetical protein
VLTQQQQEPITEPAQENNKCTKICLCIIITCKIITLIMIIGQIIVHTHFETAAATTTITTTTTTTN